MNKKSNEVIKRKIEKILKEIKIADCDRKVIEDLQKIENMDINNENIYYIENELECIEKYLKIKEKLRLTVEDDDFLNNIANELKQQRIRKTDGIAKPASI